MAKHLNKSLASFQGDLVRLTEDVLVFGFPVRHTALAVVILQAIAGLGRNQKKRAGAQFKD